MAAKITAKSVMPCWSGIFGIPNNTPFKGDQVSCYVP